MFPQLPPHKHLHSEHQQAATLPLSPVTGLCDIPSLTSRAGVKGRVFRLETAAPVFSRLHKYDRGIWGIFFFAKGYVIPPQCQEEDRPDITQTEAAGADKPCTVDGWACAQQLYHLNWAKHCIKLRGICTQECPLAVGSLFWLWPRCVFRDIFFPSRLFWKPTLRASEWQQPT